MGAPGTSCAPNAHSTSQATPSPATARVEERRWQAATRVRRSTARVGEQQREDADEAYAGKDEVRSRPADRLAQRLGADRKVVPVLDRVERPVKRREEADVEQLDDEQDAERRSDHPGQEPAGGARQGECQHDDHEPLEREPDELVRA